MSTITNRQSRSGRIAARWARRTLAPVAVAALAIGLGAGGARADQVSPYVASHVYSGYFGNSSITAAPV